MADGSLNRKNITEELRLTIVKLLGHVKQTCVERVFQVHLLDRKWEQAKEDSAGCQQMNKSIPLYLKCTRLSTYLCFLHVVVNDFL